MLVNFMDINMNFPEQRGNVEILSFARFHTDIGKKISANNFK